MCEWIWIKNSCWSKNNSVDLKKFVNCWHKQIDKVGKQGKNFCVQFLVRLNHHLVKCRSEHFVLRKKNWFFLSFYLKLFAKEEWKYLSIHEKWTLVVKRRMASKTRQPIFSFDMDMDVDETPKKIKTGNILIERQTLFAINSNLFSCGKFITRYDDMLLQFRILRHCGQYSSAPSKMRLFCSLNHTYIFAS